MCVLVSESVSVCWGKGKYSFCYGKNVCKRHVSVAHKWCFARSCPLVCTQCGRRKVGQNTHKKFARPPTHYELYSCIAEHSARGWMSDVECTSKRDDWGTRDRAVLAAHPPTGTFYLRIVVPISRPDRVQGRSWCESHPGVVPTVLARGEQAPKTGKPVGGLYSSSPRV